MVGGWKPAGFSSVSLLTPENATVGWKFKSFFFRPVKKLMGLYTGKLTCPLKRDYFNRKYSTSSNHQFSGDMLAFGECISAIIRQFTFCLFFLTVQGVTCFLLRGLIIRPEKKIGIIC